MEGEERTVKRRKLSRDDLAEALDISNSTSSNAHLIEEETQKNELHPGFDAEATATGVTDQTTEQRPADDGEIGRDLSSPRSATESPTNPAAPSVAVARQEASTLTSEALEAIDPTLSKTQQKKLRKKLEWESKREDRKVIRKQKQLAKRERKKAAAAAAAAAAAHESFANSSSAATLLPQARQARAIQLPVTILIDCAFDDLMRDHERSSLTAQITRCYSDNKNARFRAHLAVCSFTGKLRERFDNVLDHYKGWRGVRFVECDFVDAAARARGWMGGGGGDDDGEGEWRRGGQRLAGAFEKFLDTKTVAPREEDEEEWGAENGNGSADVDADVEHRKRLERGAEVVYLTSEADETLTELKPYSTYIIGGLVDKNREKGICYKRARERGLRTARLPIGEFMEMQSRKVLTTNHVNEIMLKWLECGDWGKAFVTAIPKRKGGRLKGVYEEDEEDAEDEPKELADHHSENIDRESHSHVGQGSVSFNIGEDVNVENEASEDVKVNLDNTNK